jgi:putative ABC transport system permease protein
MSDLKPKVPFMRLAWRNIRRHKRRTLLTVTAVAIAVAAITFGQAYITGIMENVLTSYSRLESGHIRIRREGYQERERFLPVHLNVGNLEEVLATARTQPGVLDAVARIRSAVLVDGAESNRPGRLLGVDLEREEPYLGPSSLLAGGDLPAPGSAEALVGTGMAERLGVSVGDEITLLGQTSYRSLGGLLLTVTGLATSGIAYLDNTLIIVPLDQAQLLVDLPDGATEVLVFAEHSEAAQELATALESAVGPLVPGGAEILSWMDQGPIMRLFQMARPVFGVVLFLLMLMAGLIIINTMLMTVMERTSEFGMEAAMGMRWGDMVKMIVWEGLAIGLIGAVVGGVLGSGVSLLLESTGFDFSSAMGNIEIPFQGMVYPDWKVHFPITSGLAGIVTSGLAALYPAWRAARMAPAEALRQ